MDEKYKDYTCKYKAEWPVDEFGRLGGMYSLVDLPIVGYSEMERDGILISQDTIRNLYHVQDVLRKTVKRVVPFDSVTEIKEFQNESDK